MVQITSRIEEHRFHMPELSVRTRVLEAGRGPVVLMLHGHPDNADEWRPLIDRLAATHRCIAPDFPGYGQSPEPGSGFDYSLAVQKRFVDSLLEHLGVNEPLTLVVHDTGGMVGTAWAAAHPERVRGLVFTNTVAFENFRWFAIARRWARRDWVGRLRASLGMKALGLKRGALFRKVFAAQSPQLDAEQLDRFVTSFALNPHALRTTLRHFRQFVDPTFFTGFEAMRRRLVETRPVRVLWGDRDPYLPTELSRRFFSAPVRLLPDAGHWVPLVAPDALAEEVRLLSAGAP